MPSDQVNAMRRAQVLRGKQEALRVLRLAMIILSNRLRLCPTSSCQRFANHLARAYGLRLGYGLTEPISSISDSKASSGKLPDNLHITALMMRDSFPRLVCALPA